jgi:hypothetical protein
MRKVMMLILAALAFGYIEGAVVVYLRAIAYPDGFHFPLEPVPARLLITEIVREAATLVLLLGIAWTAAETRFRRFAVFALCFGVWDLGYYITLKAILGWPASWLTWDILFLIPLPWTSPVLAPILVSLALTGASIRILLPGKRGEPKVTGRDWAVEITAGLMILTSFFWNVGPLGRDGIPGRYPWWLFGCGMGVGIIWFLVVILRRR